MIKIFLLRLILIMTLVFGVCAAGIAAASELPVKVPDAGNYKEVPYRGLSNFLDIDTIHSAVKDGTNRGLLLDFSGVRELLDGTVLSREDTIYGTAYMGPYPFEADEVTYTYKRFRVQSAVDNGTAFLPVGAFLGQSANSEGWKTGGRVVLRLELYLRKVTEDRLITQFLGIYDTFIRFKKEVGGGGVRYVKLISMTEGPMVNLLRSDVPTAMAISFKTDKPVTAAVVLDNGRRFESNQSARRHEIEVTGLEPGKEYTYLVEYADTVTKQYTFRAAPKPGEGEVIFAYAGDSREGTGGGMANFMGVNYAVLERCSNLAYGLGADLFVFGGDLVSGYTTSERDLRTQINGWKQALAGFWGHRPVYPIIGNHEALLKVFMGSDDARSYIALDRWPYETDSVEAVFADEMVNPSNGPGVSDPRRPTYRENVYSFLYGPVKFIGLNNNYWLGRDQRLYNSPDRTGGSPEGYIMEDQFLWLERELESGEKDPAVRYIILYAQEPVFPNGGHTQDCMWYGGNNDIRAYTYDAASGKAVPEDAGIIDVRNRLVKMVSESRKVAAVLGSDEHSYHKVLIDRNVPIGVPAVDDKDGTGRVCREGGTCSPLKELKYPTWYLVGGGAGAPYYAREKTPWNVYWENYAGTYPNHTSMRGCFYYSSQENVFIFKANKDKISLNVYNPYGEIIDTIDDLLKVKENE